MRGTGWNREDQDLRLGRVDGFENDQAECECDERPEVPVGLLAAERDALEALELSYELLDAGARPVERLREEGRPLLGRGLHGDNRADASLAGRGPVGLGIIAFVAHRGAGRDIRPEVEQDLELAAVRWKASGKPSRSTLMWILVEKPPRERPRASLEAPLFRRPGGRRRLRHEPERWWSRTSARDGRSGCSRRAPRTRPRRHPLGSAAKSVSRCCSSCRTRPGSPAT